MILVSCPACDRQYDVSHLGPGDRVRCVCDRVFLVRPRGPRTLTALCCGNCGGPVGVEEEDCPYCSAALDEAERRGITCPACFARIPNDARYCNGCGGGIRPQALVPIPDGASCGRCEGKLLVRDLDALSVVECADCEGMWLERDAFEEALARVGRLRPAPMGRGEASSVGGFSIHPVGEWEGSQAYIPCLACSEPMNRRQHRHRGLSSRVIVDVCRDHGVWLDRGELERIAAFVRGAGRSALFAPTSRRSGPEPKSESKSAPKPGTRTAGGAMDRAGGVEEEDRPLLELVRFLGELVDATLG